MACLEAYVKKALNVAKNESLTAIGIDETSLKRGHNYISLFVDLAEKNYFCWGRKRQRYGEVVC